MARLSLLSNAEIVPAAMGLSPRLPKQLTDAMETVRDYPWQDALFALSLAVLAVVIGRLVATTCLKALARWAKRTNTTVDDAIARHFPRPLRWLLPVVALDAVLPLLAQSPATEAFVHHCLVIAILVCSGWLVFASVKVLTDVIGDRYSLDKADNLRARAVQTQINGFRNIAGFVIVLMTLAFVLMTFQRVRELGAGILASAGLAGIVLGFAAQKSIATVLAGVQIAITQPIRVDDVVIVEGEWGRIEEITLTYVVIKIWDLRRLIVPISYFLERPFQNWTRVSADILGTVFLQVDYGVSLAELRAELGRLLSASPLWDGKVSNLVVTECGEKTMTVRALMGARDASDAWDLRCQVREGLIAFLASRQPGSLPRQRLSVEGATRSLS